MKRLIQIVRTQRALATGCALVFLLAWLCACAGNPQTTSIPATDDVLVTVVFPTSTGEGAGTASPIKTPPPLVIADPYALAGPCTSDECLFARMDSSGTPVGVARVQGYYGVISKTLNTGKKQACQTLTVISGSKALIKRYLALIKSGDTLNAKNAAGQLVITLALDGLSTAEKEMLTKSSSFNPVNVLLMPRPVINSAKEPCYSPVVILRVDPVPPTPMTTYTSAQLGILLQYPAAWQATESGDYLFAGDDGFFNVTRSDSKTQTAKDACIAEEEANKKDHRYGQKPTLRLLTIEGQPACMLTPSEDQPEDKGGLTFMVVQYPTQSGQLQGLLQLWADQQHIRGLGGSLKFIELQGTPTSTP